jgi:hypothetical protein
MRFVIQQSLFHIFLTLPLPFILFHPSAFFVHIDLPMIFCIEIPVTESLSCYLKLLGCPHYLSLCCLFFHPSNEHIPGPQNAQTKAVSIHSPAYTCQIIEEPYTGNPHKFIDHISGPCIFQHRTVIFLHTSTIFTHSPTHYLSTCSHFLNSQ